MTAIACTKKAPMQAPPPAPVTVATSFKENIPLYIDTLGHFAAYNTVTIQAQVQGELTGLYFEEGQEVHEGDLLFKIDSKPYVAVLDRSIAILQQNEALFAYNKSRADRYSELVGDDFVSKLDYEEYVSEMQNYEGFINQSVADIESAEINVGYCTLNSPITGITGKKLVDVGNIITDVGSKLLVINQIDPLYIDFSIPERYFDLVFQKQQQAPLNVEVYVPNTPLQTIACLQMLDNTVNPSTGMIAARGISPNPKKHFWPQQFVRIRLIVDTIEDAIMVPEAAVLPGPEGKITWVVGPNQEVTPVNVVVGESYKGNVRIKSGLTANQQVVITGQFGLAKGRKVVIRNQKDSAAQ